MTVLVLRFLHLLFMGLWVAASMYVAGDARRSIAAGPEHLPLLRDRVLRAGRFGAISGALTLLSGLGLIFALGGFGAVPRAIHVGFLITLALAVLGAKGVGGAWEALDSALRDGAPAERIAALQLRLQVFVAVFKTGWLVVFALMVFRHVIG